jgi:hypothetical protein
MFVDTAVGIKIGGATTVGGGATVGSIVGTTVGSGGGGCVGVGSRGDVGSSVGITSSAGGSSGDIAVGIRSAASCAATRGDMERKSARRKLVRMVGSTPPLDNGSARSSVFPLRPERKDINNNPRGRY